MLVGYDLGFFSVGSFAGLGFLSLYLTGKIKVFDRRGHVAKLCIVFLPLLVASLIGISLVNDYWHHWQDVFAGGVLGVFLYHHLENEIRIRFSIYNFSIFTWFIVCRASCGSILLPLSRNISKSFMVLRF